MNYELGLDLMAQYASDKNWLQQFLIHEASLRENLRNERLYGPSEELRHTRSRIVNQLNTLALQNINISFNDLCLSPDNFATERSQIYGNNKVHLDPLDEIDYRLQDQSWYPSTFPETKTISRNEVVTLQKDVDIVIFTVTDTELRAVMHLAQPLTRRKKILRAHISLETYYIGEFGNSQAVITKCRMGAIGEGSIILAAEQAQRIWRPRAVIMIGIAFGKDVTKQRIGDVLVASQIISYEPQRLGKNSQYRGPIPPVDSTLLNRFENTLNWKFERPDGSYSKAIIGPILSGEKLIDDPQFKSSLFKQFPQAVGGEMEGAGLYAVMERFNVPWLLVKSICDWADGRKNDKHQVLAAAAATSLTHFVLSQQGALDSLPKQV